MSVVKEEACVSIDPEGDGDLELFDEWGYVNSKPSDVNGSLHECNLILGLSQESDLLIESFEVWSFGFNSNENLLRHPFEGLIFFFFSIIIHFDVSLLSWVNTSIKESLEAIFKGFFPQELFVSILVDEVHGGELNVLNVLIDNLHCTEEGELILDLDKEISSNVTSGRVKSIDLDSNGDEIIHNTLDKIFDTSFLAVRLNGWIKDNISIKEVDLDIEHWWELMVSIVVNVDLVGKIFH